MIFAALNEAATSGELILLNGGLCRWHRRKDGVVVIREIVVLPEFRRMGIGRMMVSKVASQNPGCKVRACCPGEYESNKFWSAMGFTCVSFKPPDGRIRVWELPNSSTAPTASPSLLASP